MYFRLLYAGKTEGTPDQYYVTGTDEYTKYLINGAIAIAGVACISGQNLSLDWYFTSMAVADWCLQKKGDNHWNDAV